MKYKLIFSLLAISAFLSCNKHTIVENDTNVGVSKITYYPIFEMTGPEAISVVKGTAFTDPGIKATEKGTEIPVTTTGSVNTDEVGLYVLSYSATNKDGFSATAQRTVVVIPEEETAGVDLSGTYTPIGGAPADAIITKIDKGLYYTTNCWGGGSLAVIPVYFICTDGSTLIIPEQVSGGAGRIVTDAPGTYAAGLITWTVSRLDFPGGGLTLEKKWQKQ